MDSLSLLGCAYVVLIVRRLAHCGPTMGGYIARRIAINSPTRDMIPEKRGLRLPAELIS